MTGNHVRTRAHALDFTGKSWLKMVITAAPAKASSGVQIGEIDVHDISATGAGLPDDTWFFMGDSITAFAYDRTNPPSFATLIDTATAHAYFPAMINGGIGGELTGSGLARLDEALALNPDYHFFAITYGTNDSWGNKTDTSAFRSNLQMMIDKIKAAGAHAGAVARPLLRRRRRTTTLAQFNAVIDDLTRTQPAAGRPGLHDLLHAAHRPAAGRSSSPGARRTPGDEPAVGRRHARRLSVAMTRLARCSRCSRPAALAAGCAKDPDYDVEQRRDRAHARSRTEGLAARPARRRQPHRGRRGKHRWSCAA